MQLQFIYSCTQFYSWFENMMVQFSLVSECMHELLMPFECSILTALNMEFTELLDGIESLFLN